ncbi:MAG: trehalose-6-phosphate synthase [Deltaproteobacteria bacterium]|nr:trehalose-6-phosphate synthase [Deltaproteobacteria bacterium]
MTRRLKIAVVVVLGLAALTAVAYAVVTRTTRSWAERDLELRAQLAVTSARRGLSRAWRADDREALADVLADVTRDIRIMGAAACSPTGSSVATTESYPPSLPCSRLASRIPRSALGDATSLEPLHETTDIHGGSVHLSALPFRDGSSMLGFVVLVHDLSFVARRETAARTLLLAAFVVLAIAGAFLTWLAGRMARRDWTRELRRVLAGEEDRPEYAPLLRDVRELVSRMVVESDADATGGRWTPERLRAVMHQRMHGERLIVLANREPYVHQRDASGALTVLHPASGLVTALEPVMRACSGVWVAHGSGSADRETTDTSNRVRVPPGEESFLLRRVWLGEEQEQGYYYGFANEGLWPLCHLAHTRPTFRSDDWQHYRAVNRRFAEAVAEESDCDDPIVLVQDYHFALVPRMLREILPRATILSFWHIPWPNAERFGICPFREEILEGLLGSSILGFHTRQHCGNFLDSVDAYLESRVNRAEQTVVQHARETLVRPYPISIEWPPRLGPAVPSPTECRARVLDELRLPADALIGVGVDRLDYTKGIEERLLAVERLLEREPPLVGRFTFVQLAAPSRTRISRYRELDERVEALVTRINERFASGTYRAVVYLREHHEPDTVQRYYRAADVCYVSSLHDGMNLVAKEFVAARDDERGVLVLSHFTGAARELTEALIVNPYDIEEASGALSLALRMPSSEQALRIRAMRELLAELNVYRWAGRMLLDAERLRRRERLTGRISTSWQALAVER